MAAPALLQYLANLVGFEQQPSTWLQLVRLWRDRSNYSHDMSLGQPHLAFLEHPYPRVSQWLPWINLDVSAPLCPR